MNRRDFLKRLGLGASAVTLSPMLDLAAIVEASSVVLVEDPFVMYVTFQWVMLFDMPAYCGRIDDIGLSE